jgi:hypothetical protein
MRTEKVYVVGKDAATIICMDCWRSKAIEVSGIKNFHLPHRVNCPCGATFRVLFDRRRHYRKIVRLFGKYSTSDSNGSEAMLVKNLSQSSVGFQALTKDLEEREEIKDIKPGDFLHIDFMLDNQERFPMRTKVLVQSVDKGHIGAEFYNLDDHTKKELGFYIMP